MFFYIIFYDIDSFTVFREKINVFFICICFTSSRMNLLFMLFFYYLFLHCVAGRVDAISVNLLSVELQFTPLSAARG